MPMTSTVNFLKAIELSDVYTLFTFNIFRFLFSCLPEENLAHGIVAASEVECPTPITLDLVSRVHSAKRN